MTYLFTMFLFKRSYGLVCLWYSFPTNPTAWPIYNIHFTQTLWPGLFMTFISHKPYGLASLWHSFPTNLMAWSLYNILFPQTLWPGHFMILIFHGLVVFLTLISHKPYGLVSVQCEFFTNPMAWSFYNIHFPWPGHFMTFISHKLYGQVALWHSFPTNPMARLFYDDHFPQTLRPSLCMTSISHKP